MSVLYWRGKVKIVTGEMSYSAALLSTREAVEEGRKRLVVDKEQPDFDADQLQLLGTQLFDALLIKYATRSVETRESPEHKWKPLKQGEVRAIEGTEGEIIKVAFTNDLDTILDMLTALPVTLARSWSVQVWSDNEEVAQAGFLSWLSTLTTQPTSGGSQPEPSESKKRKSKRRTTTTSGEETPDTLPQP